MGPGGAISGLAGGGGGAMAALGPVGWGLMAVSVIGSLFGGGAKRREARRAEERKQVLIGELNVLEKGRQTISNPYAGVTNLSGMAKDLSGMVSNPFANLGVATQAAEIQIEEADIALANTLDTLRATGSGAGGATALAQAALQSKKGVAANIEQQEAQNEKLRAQGESKLEMLQMQEAQRIQGIGMSEAARIQQAGVAGEQFMFQTRETRQMQELNRKQALITGEAQQAVAANQGADALYAAGLSSVGTIGAAYMGNR
tara:strand:+ start:69 stop:845 length:777 start_codon:yes stop_codon:yes gene_type:complete